MEREGGSGRLRAPWLRAWLTVGIAAWVLVGTLLVTRANSQGLIDDVTISPYHLIGYAGVLVLGVFVAWAFFGALRRGRWRHAFPPLYGGLGLGFLLVVAWVVLDPIWRDTLGIRQNIEGGLAPTRLLIPAALVLLASGPVREAVALRRRHGLQPDERLIRWAGVAAAGIVGASITIVAFNPITSPLPDWSYRPGVDNSEVWTMSADGSNQTRVLAALGDGIDYSLPAWSPDGTRIAYTAWTNKDNAPQNIDLADQTASIWTMAADGSDRRELFTYENADAWIPAWSPDGLWLTYTVTAHANRSTAPAAPQANPAPGNVGPPTAGFGGSTIWLARADGTGDRIALTPDGVDATGAAWSPDGTQLAFVASSANADPDIHIATITAGALTNERIIAAANGVDWGPAWSPDGSQVAFVSDRAGNDDVWIVGVTGSDLGTRRLTDTPAGDWVPAFSPDGSRIAFVSDRTGEPEIWDMARDGTNLRNLTRHPEHYDGNWSIAYSPDGAQIAFGTSSFQDPVTSGWVREDLASAQALLFGLSLAPLALVLVALGAPFGSFTAVLLIVVAAGAFQNDAWRYLPAAVIAGLAVDGIVAIARSRWRSRIAAAALPAFANLGLALTIGTSGSLFWSLTLVLGVALASGLLGWALAEVVDRLLQHPAHAAAPAGTSPSEGAAR